MKGIVFVEASKMQILEHYASSLLSGLASLKTLELYHVQAFKKGLLDEVEQETGKTICWEIQRLISLYQTQIQKIVERTGLDENEVIEEFKKLFPNQIINPREKG